MTGSRVCVFVCLLTACFFPMAAAARPGFRGGPVRRFQPLRAAGIQDALDTALRGTQTIAVVLDFRTGRVLAAERPKKAARLAAAPGSTLKPFFLTKALESRLIHESTAVFCDRRLRIAGRDLACTHPAGLGGIDAEHALAYSCNTYFATLATRFSPTQAAAVLREYGFGERPHLFASEGRGTVRQPENESELKLMVLGLDDSFVTTAQMAHAYWRLARDPKTPAVVMRGLAGSASYGMARQAAVDGVKLAGKTGTASDPQESWTHGWFAGFASRSEAKIVVVVYVPHGSGGDAALMAQRFLVQWLRRSGSPRPIEPPARANRAHKIPEGRTTRGSGQSAPSLQVASKKWAKQKVKAVRHGRLRFQADNEVGPFLARNPRPYKLTTGV